MNSLDLGKPGKSGKLGKLGFGGAGVGNLYRAIPDGEALATVLAAWDAGIRYFDTAPHYGLGLSEQRLGAVLRDKPRNEFVISTKVGRLLEPNASGGQDPEGFDVPATTRRVWDFSEAGIRRSIEDSLERLGLNHVDIAYLHDPDVHDLKAGITQGLPALEKLRSSRAPRPGEAALRRSSQGHRRGHQLRRGRVGMRRSRRSGPRHARGPLHPS